MGPINRLTTCEPGNGSLPVLRSLQRLPAPPKEPRPRRLLSLMAYAAAGRAHGTRAGKRSSDWRPWSAFPYASSLSCNLYGALLIGRGVAFLHVPLITSEAVEGVEIRQPTIA
jgi:hypothetical protein